MITSAAITAAWDGTANALGGVATTLARVLITTAATAAAVALVAVLVYELHSSAIQARLLSDYAAQLSYDVAAGPSSRIVFPGAGPFDRTRGYSKLPEFTAALEARGFRVERQVRLSPQLAQLIAWGVPPPYSESPVARLQILAAHGAQLYEAVEDGRVFERFEDIPPLLIYTLLFMENRELLEPGDPRRNPVIEWNRLAKAALSFAAHKLGLSLNLEGGSTLATQLEKYRHSPEGRTNSAIDKLRQLGAASLKAYRDGPDTRHRRRQIVVDYLNTLPLASAPGYGEVYGLGNGLHAWFGLELEEVRNVLSSPKLTPAKVRAYKDLLALLAALRGPTYYLVQSHEALEQRVEQYTHLLARAGVIDARFAAALLAAPIELLPRSPTRDVPPFRVRKAPNAIRTTLMKWLRLPSLYDLDRLDLRVQSTIDAKLQESVTQLFQDLRDPSFVAAHGLNQRHLLVGSDPRNVIYSLLLFERAPEGNVLRVHADNLERPFDINDGVKLDLGSTAKLRTLVHYLELVTLTYRELSSLGPAALSRRMQGAQDPITHWVARTLHYEPELELSELLERALDRRYSASPYEQFFTGGGAHTFGNFSRDDNARVMTVREALRRSTNLVFIRLMRDLVRFHRARLPYDSDAVLSGRAQTQRRRLLEEVADDEAKTFLARAFRRYRHLPPEQIVARFLRHRTASKRHLAMAFLAWHRGASADDLGEWMRSHIETISAKEVRRLYRSYGNPDLNLSDFGYLLSRHPLEVWCAGELMRHPQATWKQIVERSQEARRIASAWLFHKRNRRAQDVRLRIRVEKDAFARMTPYWQRLGFPFRALVPTLATAIGNSADRPAALATLMGIIVNDGMRQPTWRFTELDFGKSTPYETSFTPAPNSGDRVMAPEVAHAVRSALADVVQAGTGQRVAGAFVGRDSTPTLVGGKTGSGDNRFKTFNRYGEMTSSRAVNRTATFVFYIDDRYYGVLTAFVPGRQAEHYQFTSSLALAVLKLAAPAINSRLQAPPHGTWAQSDPPQLRPIPAAATTAGAGPTDIAAAMTLQF